MTLRTVAGSIARFLSSAMLAIALLSVILASCVAGVTLWRGAEAGRLIFSTAWFNGLLVLLVVNVAFCFFGRLRFRRLTIISSGMILFHLSFVAMLAGIIYNSLFSFNGLLRLTEGETLPNNQPASYDRFDAGRLFDFTALRGETTLVKLHPGYRIDGENKRVAYQIAVADGGSRVEKTIYVTNSLEYRGIKYFCDREGYSVLVVLTDSAGNELYGAHLPLQSYRQPDGTYRYALGTKATPYATPFPPEYRSPVFELQVEYAPEKKQERAGRVTFSAWPFQQPGRSTVDKPSARGTVAVGEFLDAGGYRLSVKEVRYWVAMTVRYDPGYPLILSSLWAGMAGLVATTLGRMRRGRPAEREVA